MSVCLSCAPYDTVSIQYPHCCLHTFISPTPPPTPPLFILHHRVTFCSARVKRQRHGRPSEASPVQLTRAGRVLTCSKKMPCFSMANLGQHASETTSRADKGCCMKYSRVVASVESDFCGDIGGKTARCPAGTGSLG